MPPAGSQFNKEKFLCFSSVVIINLVFNLLITESNLVWLEERSSGSHPCKMSRSNASQIWVSSLSPALVSETFHQAPLGLFLDHPGLPNAL